MDVDLLIDLLLSKILPNINLARHGLELHDDLLPANTNKWMFGAKGTGFQWVSPALHSMSEPVVTSFEHLDGFPDNMFIQGTKNDAPYLAYTESSTFYSWIGGLVSARVHKCSLHIKS